MTATYVACRLPLLAQSTGDTNEKGTHRNVPKAALALLSKCGFSVPICLSLLILLSSQGSKGARESYANLLLTCTWRSFSLPDASCIACGCGARSAAKSAGGGACSADSTQGLVFGAITVTEVGD